MQSARRAVLLGIAFALAAIINARAESLDLEGIWTALLPQQGDCPLARLTFIVQGNAFSGSITVPGNSGRPVGGMIDSRGQGTIEIVQARASIAFIGDAFETSYASPCGPRHIIGARIAPWTAVTLPDTPADRARLAAVLVELEWPTAARAFGVVIEANENALPPEYRPAFRATMEKILPMDALRRQYQLTYTKHMTTLEMSALIEFERSLIGRSVLSKTPAVTQDIALFVRDALERAMRPVPPPQRPPQFHNL